MSLADKRKATSVTTDPSSSSAAANSKRVRVDEPVQRRQRRRQDTDFFEGDPEIEEEDRRRIRKDQKSGRIDDRGEDLSESDDDSGENGADLFDENEADSDFEADAGSHRRRAEKKRGSRTAGAAAGDEDDDMFDVADDDGSKLREGKKPAGAKDDYLKLGELEEGQDFGSKTRSALDAVEDDAELLRGGGDQDDDDLDPELELEDEDDDKQEGDDDDDEADQDDAQQGGFVDLNAYAERSPPASPSQDPKRKPKPKAPKVTGFNMKEEMRTGKFDAEGNYHENQRDPHAQHDAWLTGVYSRSKILEARQAQQKRDHEAKQKERAAQQADGDEDQVKKNLVEYMHRGETVQKTLQRLGKLLAERKKAAKSTSTDGHRSGTQGQADVKQAAADVESVTHLSSVLMSRFGRLDIYDQRYESLLRDVHRSGLVRETFDPAAKLDAPAPAVTANDGGAAEWEYRWTPSYLAAAARETGTSVSPDIETFGPFTLADLRAWAHQGYFGDNADRILLRPSGSNDAWTTFDQVIAMCEQ